MALFYSASKLARQSKLHTSLSYSNTHYSHACTMGKKCTQSRKAVKVLCTWVRGKGEEKSDFILLQVHVRLM